MSGMEVDEDSAVSSKSAAESEICIEVFHLHWSFPQYRVLSIFFLLFNAILDEKWRKISYCNFCNLALLHCSKQIDDESH